MNDFRRPDLPLHVVAAVLSDDHGRVLLTQRTPERDFAGCWEFPGGKVKPGESAAEALARELHEELGIRIGATAPMIAVPWANGRSRLLLDVLTVASFDGLPFGAEGQALQWHEIEMLAAVSMPPADRPAVAALSQPALYAITPEPPSSGPADAFLNAFDRLLGSGIRRVQLRAKSLQPRPRAHLAAAVHARTHAAGAELLINGDQTLAEALGCGLHMTSAQLAESRARPAVPLLAASCHHADDLRRAEQLGCDFVVLGPVAATRSHPQATALGWDGFATLRERTSLPIYALGGMRPDDLDIARRHGAQGIAAISALWPAG